MMATLYISLGTNVGDRVQNLARAEELLKKHGFVVVKKSKQYETEEWASVSIKSDAVKNPLHKNELYINQCIELNFDLSPVIAFEKLRNIEKEMGRDRIAEGTYKKEHNAEFAPRIIDLDILMYDDWFVREGSAYMNDEGVYEELIIPHPRMHLRKFVLVPLAEIAPHVVHPVLNKSIHALLKLCPDLTIIKS